MNNNTTAPTYTLRGLQLIGWRDMQCCIVILRVYSIIQCNISSDPALFFFHDHSIDNFVVFYDE